MRHSPKLSGGSFNGACIRNTRESTSSTGLAVGALTGILPGAFHPFAPFLSLSLSPIPGARSPQSSRFWPAEQHRHYLFHRHQHCSYIRSPGPARDSPVYDPDTTEQNPRLAMPVVHLYSIGLYGLNGGRAFTAVKTDPSGKCAYCQSRVRRVCS